MFSLNEQMIHKILTETFPSFQGIDRDTLNLGYGYIYYGLARLLRPQTTVIIGSKKGFSVICFALGLKDNEGYGIKKVSCYDTQIEKSDTPKLYFVDPSYSVERGDPNHMFGIGAWDCPEEVLEWWKKFGVDEIVTHYKMRSDEFSQSDSCPAIIDCLLIDGDHTYEGIRFDIDTFGKRLASTGIILAHDVHPAIRKEFGGPKAYDEVDLSAYEKIRIGVYPGLAIFIPRRARVPLPEIDRT